jgi:phospholipid-binding lipoprotein MlaA
LIVAGLVLWAMGLPWSAIADPAARGEGADAVHADPFEKLNRKGFAVEMAMDRVIVGPLATVYRLITPGPIGAGLHHLLVNLSEPGVVINDTLQLRPKRAFLAAGRFLVNSTAGLGGLIDVAARDGVPHRNSSFGDTLGRYGVGPGPYLFLPLVGPSTVRDLAGDGVDATLDPIHFVRYRHRTKISIAVAIAGGLDQRAGAQQALGALLGDAADPYATLRSAYLQHRQSEVEGEPALPATLPDLDDPGAKPASAPAAPRTTASVGPARDQSTAFHPLPDQQRGQADRQVARALEQGEREGKLGGQAEQGADDVIGRLLDADTHRGDEGGAAHREHQALKGEDAA